MDAPVVDEGLPRIGITRVVISPNERFSDWIGRLLVGLSQ